ncbi:SoxR reducing system RseC family protein [Zhongshania aliphaticivorans]|uniref:SoxR reducing system RseC family protein n=1 Tax=Zhongshania aliphaticivorans TaxID=1470434 RepID=UPI0012E41121|nr:SoxR reducing system RseC family protein [Zhongshania aliphaticivorans]CAA0080595.1 Protein RseC [Zhongshania aliphaticivorans]
MITETGRVVGIEDKALWVETIRRSTCGSCAAQKGCGQGLMNKATDGRRNQLRVLLGSQSADAFHLDDEVEISIPERALITGAMMVYLLPLLSMIAGMALASQYASSDGVAAVGALLGFVLGMVFVRLHAMYIQNKPAFQASVVAKYTPTTVDSLAISATLYSE